MAPSTSGTDEKDRMAPGSTGSEGDGRLDGGTGTTTDSKEADARRGSWPRALAAVATVAALVSLAFTPWVAGTHEAADEAAPAFPRRGSVPPGFALPVLTTEAPWVGTDTVRLSDYEGRWVYLDVFGSWCPPCRRKHPRMQEIAAELDEKGAAVVALLLEDRPEAASTWLQANGGMAWPYLVLDDETKRRWGISGAPMGFLISPEGRVERLCFGCSTGPDGVETLSDAVS